MVKHVNLPEIGIVKLYKRKGVRSLRLTLHMDDYVRVTLPKWLPYKAGIDFAKSKKDWISLNRQQRTLLTDNQLIGKRHRLFFIPDPAALSISARVNVNSIRISYPNSYDIQGRTVQDAARIACLRALKKEAEELLPVRLRQLAIKGGFSYSSVNVRRLKSRWGSCNKSKVIVLSIFLTQLPWELIDYVILHELIHTQVLSHGPEFWEIFESHYPEPKNSRKLLRDYRPVI